MTVRELQQLFYLGRLIERERQRLEELRSAAVSVSPRLTGMPGSPGAKDRIGETVPKIVDQEEEILRNIREYTEAREKLTDYIRRVPNIRIKLILSLRFIDRLPWQQVAETIGGTETEYSVKQACYRYVDGRTAPEWAGEQVTVFDEDNSGNT